MDFCGIRANTFLGKFCVVLLSPVIALVAGAIVALSAVLGIIIYLAFIVSALLITVIHKYC